MDKRWYFAFELRPWFWAVRVFDTRNGGTHNVIVVGPVAVAWPKGRWLGRWF